LELERLHGSGERLRRVHERPPALDEAPARETLHLGLIDSCGPVELSFGRGLREGEKAETGMMFALHVPCSDRWLGWEGFPARRNRGAGRQAAGPGVIPRRPRPSGFGGWPAGETDCLLKCVRYRGVSWPRDNAG